MEMEEEVSGEIARQETEYVEEGTLDEPILVTIRRDVSAIMKKCWHVLLPGRNKTLLHDWDLWGPLILCLVLGILLHGSGHGDNEEPTIHFVHVFVMIWGGAAVVTINAQLLRGKISFFQSVCTLGYCLLPLTLAVFISRVLLTSPLPSSVVFVMRLVIVIIALFWAVWGSLGFLSDYLPADRKALAIYPILLFYFAISCLILAQTNSLI